MKILSLGFCLGLGVLLAGCSVEQIKAQSAADVQRIQVQGKADVSRITAQGQADVGRITAQAEVEAARAVAETQVVPEEPHVPTVRVIGGYQETGWRNRMGGNPYAMRSQGLGQGYDGYGRGHDRGRTIYQGQPYVVPLPPPPGPGWVPYDNGLFDNGWMRSRCIANC